MFMTYEEIEKPLVALRDNQVVQGALLGRLGLAVERNAKAIARNSEAFGKLADGLILVQAAAKGLADTVERFVKGLQNDGYRRLA